MNMVNTFDSRFGLILFALLFSLFPVYQFLLYNGLIGPFLGGYYAQMSAVCFAIAFIYWLITIIRRVEKFYSVDAAFISVCLLFSAVAVYHLNNFNKYDSSIDLLSSIPQLGAFFYIFRYLNISERVTKIVIFISFLIYSYVLFTLKLGSFTTELELSSNDLSSYATYQSLSLYYLIVVIALLVNAKFLIFRLAIYLIAFWCLYLTGARSEFLIFLVIVIVNEVIHSSPAQLVIEGIGIFFALLILYLLGLNIFGFFETDNRIYALYSEGAYDQSFVAREYILKDGLTTILHNPFFGNFASYRSGEYMHNILSLWADYGGVIFFIFLYFLIKFIYKLFALVHMSKIRSSTLYFSYLLFIVYFIEILVLKPYNFQLTGFFFCIALFFQRQNSISPK
ncbi:O-antigen ligase family protein [Sphingorhabdus lutea]|nr:O-antigen ligase family protein [Sphingorhabdus lutea]